MSQNARFAKLFALAQVIYAVQVAALGAVAVPLGPNDPVELQTNSDFLQTLFKIWGATSFIQSCMEVMF